MFHLILYQPEIPPNTGNIIRLCANSGATLHLVRPLGFELRDRQLKRAGLDYHEYASIQVHDNFDACLDVLGATRVYAISTRGDRVYTDPAFRAGDSFLFGPETRGLPQDVLDRLPSQRILRIPMRPQNRSLNVSNAAAVILYEAWRQLDFKGGS